MTALLETVVQAAGDPRHLAEFKALCEELAKLDHPACPDVDWERIEQLCAALFEKHGVDLQSLVVFVLARGHRHGLDGVMQGLAVLETLLAQWPTLWPSVEATRLEILDWLYRRLLLLFRGLSPCATAVPVIVRLQVQLETAHGLLQCHQAAPLESLSTLHRYLAGVLMQLEQRRSPAAGLAALSDANEVALLKPVVIVPAPSLPPLVLSVAQPRKHRAGLWGAGVVLLMALLAWAGWSHWQEDRDRATAVPEVTSLDRPVPFELGSAEIGRTATYILASAMFTMKAQPGWLIVITGHADSSGDSLRNSELAHERAVAVRDWLQRMGNVPGDCFAIRNAADQQPVADNDSARGRADNRRVEIRRVPEPGACSAAP